MFERFTERAHQAVVLAADETRTLGHDFLRTEHILLGLLREKDGLGARVLDSLGITLEGARTEVVASLGKGDSRGTSQIPFTPRANEALELSSDEADAMNHGFIGTEHVLLGLIAVGDEALKDILAKLGSSPGQIRTRMQEMLSGSA